MQQLRGRINNRILGVKGLNQHTMFMVPITNNQYSLPHNVLTSKNNCNICNAYLEQENTSSNSFALTWTSALFIQLVWTTNLLRQKKEAGVTWKFVAVVCITKSNTYKVHKMTHCTLCDWYLFPFINKEKWLTKCLDSK